MSDVFNSFVTADVDDVMRDCLELAFQYSQIDGAHHKNWVIDQMVRKLTGENYEQFVDYYAAEDDDGNPEYEWDEGIAP
jgi:hypothetical protein